jgi:cytochrome c-type biogenesis protein CcmE
MRARKKRRLYLVLACGIGLGSATALTLVAFSSTLTYFLGPKEVLQKKPTPGMSFRLGGIVQAGTVATTITNGIPTTTFRVTDGQASIPVTYSGVLPDLFREGQGVVATGAFDGKGVFVATTILAKHDERYMPREVVDSLKKQGRWQEGSTARAEVKP